MMERIADNATKIKQNKVLPYLVSKVVEVRSRHRMEEGADDSYWMWMRRFRRERSIMNIMQRRRNVQLSRHRQDRSAPTCLKRVKLTIRLYSYLSSV